MAITVLTATQLTKNTISVMPTNAAVASGTYDAEYVWNKRDGQILLLIENSNSGSTAYNVTIQGGNADVFGEVSSTSNDYTFSLAAATTKCINIDSAKFVNTSGTNKGKLIISSTNVEVKVGVIALP